LVTIGRPFDITLSTKNIGLGTHKEGQTISLITPPTLKNEAPAKSLQIPRLEPGQTEQLKWEKFSATQKGDLTVQAGSSALAFHVFDPEPPTPAAHSDQPQATVTPGQPIAATVSNAWSRLCFVTDDTDAYAIAETWNGKQWQRAASLYPLVSGKLADSESYTLAFRHAVESFQPAADNSLVVTVRMGKPETNWLAKLTFTPSPDNPRIQIKCDLDPQRTPNCSLLKAPPSSP